MKSLTRDLCFEDDFADDAFEKKRSKTKPESQTVIWFVKIF